MTFLFYLFTEFIALGAFYMGINKKMKDKRQKGIIMIAFAFVLLLCVIVFRDLSVGADYKGYYDAIRRVQYNQMLSYDESWLSIGLIGMIRLAVLIGVPSGVLPFVITGIIAFMTLYFFFKAFVELSSKPTLSLYIFLCFCLYFQMMNQFKQMLAISIVLFAFKYIDKSLVKYVAIILFACAFHPSAGIMLPMYFICRIRINKKIIAMYFLAGITAVLLYPRIVNLIQFTRYGKYIGWEGFDVSFNSSTVLNLGVRLILLVCCLLVKKRVVHKNPKNEILYHMVMVCTVLQLFAVISHVFGRVTTYFYTYYILLLPDVFEEYKIYITKKSAYIFNILIYFILFLYQCVYYFEQSKIAGYNTYLFIF